MLSLAPWYYRNLLIDNELIEPPEFYEATLLDNQKCFESVVSIKNYLRPHWVSESKIYRNSDGSGASSFLNIAIYKAISEALERLAYYELIDEKEKEFSFDINPTTTGMAAFPSFGYKQARNNAISEAIERWAIHELNHSNVPVVKHYSSVKNLNHYEVLTPFNHTKVSLLQYDDNGVYSYAFAGGVNLEESFKRALVELGRNVRVLKRVYANPQSIGSLEATVDKTLLFYSTDIGLTYFNNLISSSPCKIKNLNPKVICDKPLVGKWTTYTKVWRYLLEDSYFDYSKNHTFFMF